MTAPIPRGSSSVMAQRVEAPDRPGRVTWARMVQHHAVLDYLLCGWMIGEGVCGTHRHHRYAVIMVWPCQCRMVEPTGARA